VKLLPVVVIACAAPAPKQKIKDNIVNNAILFLHTLVSPPVLLKRMEIISFSYLQQRDYPTLNQGQPPKKHKVNLLFMII
jgi:hypothetical protein